MVSWILVSVLYGKTKYIAHYNTLNECRKHAPHINVPVVALLTSIPDFYCKKTINPTVKKPTTKKKLK